MAPSSPAGPSDGVIEGDARLTFRAVREEDGGEALQRLFEESWPAYRSWYLRDGEAARSSYAVCRRMLRAHMPELVPVWERLVDLAGGGDLAARMLSLYDPPPFIGGCSQAFFPHGEPLLVRNYDYHPSLFEAVVLASRLTGRAVLGTSDCVWGLLDGVNDAGLAVSFGFGGRRAVADGFCITLAVRYLLELCETAGEAAERLARLPVQLSYNVALVDAAGRRLTVFVAPDRPARIEPIDASTNHQGEVEWPEYAKVTRSVERLERLRRLLDEPSLTRARLVGAFLRPPLHGDRYAAGFGTLYTGVYRPAARSVEYRWPGSRWRQSLSAFEPGEHEVGLPAEHARTAPVWRLA